MAAMSPLERRVQQNTNDIESIYEIMTDIQGTVDGHTRTLDQHTAILNQHSTILNEHSTILNEHSATLASHGDKLDEILELLRAP